MRTFLTIPRKLGLPLTCALALPLAGCKYIVPRSTPTGKRIFAKHGFQTQQDTAPPSQARIPDYGQFDKNKIERYVKITAQRKIVYSRLAEYLVQRFGLAESNGIGIDIGSGPGNLIFELAKRTGGFYWINADINTWHADCFMAEAAKLDLAHRTGFIFADACALPFRDGQADVVVSRGSYQFWDDLQQGISEVHRVLCPGGRAFIGRGVSPTMPENEVRDLTQKKLIGGPKYDPDEDAARFRTIMDSLEVQEYEVIRHIPKDPSLNYGVWLYFRK